MSLLIDTSRTSQNQGSRFGERVQAVVIHTTEGSFEGSVAWLCDPESHASAHYVVAKDGRIASLVPETRAAWHAGNPTVNHQSVGVELATCSRDAAGRLVDPATAFPVPLLWPAAQLVADICRRNGILASRRFIIGHAEVPDPLDPRRLGGRSHHTDPGAVFPWAHFMADVERLLGPVPNVT